MLSVEEALSQILANIQPLPTLQVPLHAASNLVLAEDVYAHHDVPPFANSAMDGFALLSRDSQQLPSGPPRLRVIGEIPAGYVATQRVEPGTAMRIMTGAALPPGADSVIQIELTRSSGPASDSVEILQFVQPGNNIRPAGEDMRKGQRVLTKGTTLGAWEIGILATLGLKTIPVIRRARVAILGTGDELIEPGQPLQPGQIYDSNSYLLEAAVHQAGGEPARLASARDTGESLREKLQEAAQYDLILTSGGVSVGDFDLVKDIMQEQGQMQFWRINMKPGKPVAFGSIGGTPLIGLPGNPVSSAVTFELFAYPALRKLQGHQWLEHQQVTVTVKEAIQDYTPRRHYIRAHVTWEGDHFEAHVTGNQGSNIMTSLRDANALLVIPEGERIQAGGQVSALLLKPMHQ